MKILLDENIDVRFKASFTEKHSVYTVKDMGWNGMELKMDNYYNY